MFDRLSTTLPSFSLSYSLLTGLKTLHESDTDEECPFLLSQHLLWVRPCGKRQEWRCGKWSFQGTAVPECFEVACWLSSIIQLSRTRGVLQRMLAAVGFMCSLHCHITSLPLFAYRTVSFSACAVPRTFRNTASVAYEGKRKDVFAPMQPVKMLVKHFTV